MAGLIIFLQSCKDNNKNDKLESFNYNDFKSSIRAQLNGTTHDSSNIFDANEFVPGYDSLDKFLGRIDTLWRQELELMEKSDTSGKGMKSPDVEKDAIIENIKALDSFLMNRKTAGKVSCTKKNCTLYADIVKSEQKLYLYIGGELQDTFLVSTGMGKYETRNLDLSPGGPLFIKYTSKKFPGGNYQGLGNMPYAVFLRGGYAIHGTTPGNFSRLGKKASHGCIRLHPENAKIFFELVKIAGLENTWVTIRDI